MPQELSKKQAESLIDYIQEKLASSPCDHSRKNTKKWAEKNDFDWDDLIDLLDENGAFCDCEVTFNLPEGQDIRLSNNPEDLDDGNPWKLPPNFVVTDPEKVFTNVLVSKHSEKNKCYAPEDELLIPAPKGAKAKKRIRKSVHFFIGIESGLPNEIGFVKKCDPLTAREFARKVRKTAGKDFARFSESESAFFLGKLTSMKEGQPVGTHFMTIGIIERHEEMRIHKVVLYDAPSKENS